MASDETWAKLRYFKKDSTVDRWGDPSKIDDNLLLVLDDFRHYLGLPIYILWGNQGKHSDNSFHYVKNGSCAVDIAIPDFDKHPMDLLIEVFRFPFTGVGYYPQWKWNGKIANGLHLDTRPYKWDGDFTKNYRESRWIGVKNAAGKQIYLSMNWDSLDTYFKGAKNGILS